VPADTLDEISRAVATLIGAELPVNALPTSLTVAVGTGTTQRLVILRLEAGRLDLQKLALLKNGLSPPSRTRDVATTRRVDRRWRAPATAGNLRAAVVWNIRTPRRRETHEIQVVTLAGLAIRRFGALADR
jgi:hypothetical protein